MMTTLQTWRGLALTLLMAAVTGGMAMAKEAEASAAKPMTTFRQLQEKVVDEITGFNMSDFNMDDATVEIQFVVNKEGDLALVHVDGNNCIINTYVSQILRNKKMYVSEDLSNTLHKVTVRYVRI